MEKSKTKKYFLVDNGSLRPESVLYIRDIAHQLSKVSGKKVEPAGIMHSHKVDPLKLNRIPGLSMEAFFQSMDSILNCRVDGRDSRRDGGALRAAGERAAVAVPNIEDGPKGPGTQFN